MQNKLSVLIVSLVGVLTIAFIVRAVGGADTQVQYNNNGVEDGSPNFTFRSSTNLLSVTNVSTTNATATDLYVQKNIIGDIFKANYYRFNGNSNVLLGSDVGGIVANGGYLYAAGSGNSLYVQNKAIFRGGLSNDSTTYLQINGGTSGVTYINGTLSIGTPTPSTSPSSTNSLFVSSNNKTVFVLDSTGNQGSCEVKKDSDGVGYTFVTYNNGVQIVSTTDCR